ncbi:MAG: hypothetical protein ACE5FA_12890 [Dehalococcoidia bacterium]
MGWTIQNPGSTPNGSGEICILVSGGTSAPSASVSHDGGRDSKVSSVKDLGGGIWRICFWRPPGTNRSQITVSGGGASPASTYL